VLIIIFVRRESCRKAYKVIKYKARYNAYEYNKMIT